MFVADLYLTLSYFVSFVHDYCDKLTNYRAIIFKFSHLSRDNCSFYRAMILTYRAINLNYRAITYKGKKKDCNVPYGPP